MNKIIAERVCFGYSFPEEILHNISFEIPKGSFFGIIGPNGGGKSTLLKLLLGFLKPSCGHIIAPEVVKMAYVPQAFSFDRLFPITVEEVVLGGRAKFLSGYKSFSKVDMDACHEALVQVHLRHIAKKSFGSLSHGQAQRVLLARALASCPEVLFLDEPTSSVDSQAEAIILEILFSLKGKITIIMVTHGFETIVKMVDGVLMVQSGSVTAVTENVCSHISLGVYHKK